MAQNPIRFNVNLHQGLNDTQVTQRMQEHLYNEEVDKLTKSFKMIFKDNFFTLFNLINAVLAGLIIYIGSWKNLLFLGTIISNLVIGIFQEIRSKRVLDKLALITQSNVPVIRNGKEVIVHINELVLDDIMLVKTGSQVGCDSIVKDGKVEVNESLITGESDIIVKQVGDSLYSGSFIVSGNATLQVEHVGKDNYAQTIMSDAKVQTKYKSQLRDSINFIIKIIGIIIIPLGIMLFIKQFYFDHYGFNESIIATVAALIGMIPEGLVLLTSVALAVGTIHLARHKTLVQELYCIETLARVDTLCLDKTGTITQGEMRVEEMFSIDGNDYLKAISNVVHHLNDENSTAYAIQAYARKDTSLTPLVKIPFSSSRKLSAISFKDEGTYILGAYSFVCKNQNKRVVERLQTEANRGYRIITLAHSEQMIIDDKIPEDAKAVAFLALSDPIREEAPETLAYFEEQGVDIKVISGDDPATVHEIARKAKLKNYDQFIDASLLADDDMMEAVKKYTVFGRVTPEQKKLMILCLKEQGHITAMIGDGVNDVMALKAADCSIAMASGSETAKNVSNLVLLDSNFANVPQIVAEGRRVINNIQRASSLFLVKTIFSVLLAILTLFLSSKYPYTPIQLTLISTITIGIPSFFLALENNYSRVQGNFLINVFTRAIPGALMVIICIVYVNILRSLFGFENDDVSTMCVILTTISGLIVLYRVCTPFTKKRLVLFNTMCILFISAIIFGDDLFMITPLSLFELGWLIGGCIAIPFVMDIIYRIGSKMTFIRTKIESITKNK